MTSKLQKDARKQRLMSDDPAQRLRSQRARAGGLAVVAKHGVAHLRQLGQAGGQKAGQDTQTQSQNGKAGYQATLRSLGQERLNGLPSIGAWRDRRSDDETLLRIGRQELIERAIEAHSAQQLLMVELLEQAQKLVRLGEERLRELQAQRNAEVIEGYPSKRKVWA